MRPLTEEELCASPARARPPARTLTPPAARRSKTLFDKLAKYIGHGIKALIDRPDGRFCFRLHRDRVYYLNDALVKSAAALPRDKLMMMGCSIGKFTKTKKFKLHVTSLDYLAQHAQYKVWLKPAAEQSFLYGNHVLKAGLGRITEDTPQYQGVVVLSMADVPLGFGIAAKSTAECRKLDPQGIVVLHQADIGEYLRDEESLC